MGTPFFSVVVPTKNRPALLWHALHSALHQEFDDYEVIVSDNCNDETTRQTIDAFRAHGRLRCFRTDAELSMPDHWEFATSKAGGRYVLVLTDRSVLTPRALARIHQVLLSHDERIAVCSWRWSLYDDARGIRLADAGGAPRGDAVALDSASVGAAFVNQSRSYPYLVPRGLNSCYRDDLGRSIRDRFGRLFWPISPDFTSGFLLLAETPRIVHIDDALFISQGLGVSNGGRGVASTALPYMETLGIKHFYEHVPIKAPIVENLNFNDFISIQQRAGGNLDRVSINWVEYFVACYRELLEKRGAGLAGTPALSDMVAEWEKALAGCDPATRAAVKARISKLTMLRVRMLLKSSPLGPVLAELKRLMLSPIMEEGTR